MVEERFDIKFRQIGEIKVLTLEGMVDFTFSEEIVARFEHEYKEGENWILNLSHALIIDSEAIKSVIKIYKRIKGFNGNLIIVCGQNFVYEILKKTGIDMAIKIKSSIESALDEFKLSLENNNPQ